MLGGQLAAVTVDSLMRAILRAGAYELIARPDVPAKVVIDEYVGLTHAFEAEAKPPSSTPRSTSWRISNAPPNSAETPPDGEF